VGFGFRVAVTSVCGLVFFAVGKRLASQSGVPTYKCVKKGSVVPTYFFLLTYVPCFVLFCDGLAHDDRDQLLQLAPLPLKIVYKSYLLDMQRLAGHFTLQSK
jgi:hypothetical protein